MFSVVAVINSRQNIRVNRSYSLLCDLIHTEFRLTENIQRAEISTLCAEINDKTPTNLSTPFIQGYIFATGLFILTSHESNCQD